MAENFRSFFWSPRGALAVAFTVPLSVFFSKWVFVSMDMFMQLPWTFLVWQGYTIISICLMFIYIITLPFALKSKLGVTKQ